MNIAFVGGGVMGEAMIAGILAKGVTSPSAIVAADVLPARLELLKQRYAINTTSSDREAAQDADVVVLSIKPQSLGEATGVLRGALGPAQLVLSIVAGVTIATLRSRLEHSTIVRVMPNTPAQIGQGISVWTATGQVSGPQKEMARSILAALGQEIYVEDEKYVDMATAVSGSGPAYVFLVIEAMIDAAVHLGFARDIAQQLVLQTVLGSSLYAQQTGKHPAELRNMVTSPGGTTAEGLLRLERGQLRAIFTEAILAAYEKAKLLGG